MINIIVAIGKNNAMGKNNDIPWNLPNHLKHLIEITDGHNLIVGRKTFENFHKVLSNNVHLILSRTLNYYTSSKNSLVVFHELKDLLTFTRSGGEFYIIGGSEIYNQFLPYTDRIYMTELDIDVEADTYFPELCNYDWLIKKQEQGILDENNTIPHKFIILERKFKISE